MMDGHDLELIVTLQIKCASLEMQVGTLAALAAALIKSMPNADIVRSRWAGNIGPALVEFGQLDPAKAPHTAAELTSWIEFVADGLIPGLPPLEP